MSKREKRSFFLSFLQVLLVIAVFYAIKFYETSENISLAKYGLGPKTFKGLFGIFTSPFLHGNWEHLNGNAISLLVIGGLFRFYYREISIRVILWIWLMGGLWAWALGAQGSTHIGASGVVYGLASFIFFSGLLRKDKRALGLGLFIVFSYGYMVWWMLPVEQGISWEGHLTGALAGAVCAWYFRKYGDNPVRYSWEFEEEEEDENEDEAAYWKTENQAQPTKVVYHLRKKEEEES